MTARNLAMFAVTFFAANACGGGSGISGYGSPPPTTNPPPVADQVNATANLAFDPSTLNTKVGHVVTFAFGSVGHNIYFDAATWAVADQAPSLLSVAPCDTQTPRRCSSSTSRPAAIWPTTRSAA